MNDGNKQIRICVMQDLSGDMQALSGGISELWVVVQPRLQSSVCTV